MRENSEKIWWIEKEILVIFFRGQMNLSSGICDSNLTYFNFILLSSPAVSRSLKEIHLAVTSRNELKLKSEMMNKLLREIFFKCVSWTSHNPRLDSNYAPLKQFRVYFCPTLDSKQIKKKYLKVFLFIVFFLVFWSEIPSRND